VAGCCEYGDETSSSGATELVHSAVVPVLWLLVNVILSTTHSVAAFSCSFMDPLERIITETEEDDICSTCRNVGELSTFNGTYAQKPNFKKM
jgi:hypothetical protein